MDFPQPKQKPLSGAIDFICEQLNQSTTPITILAIGPLTNMARVIKWRGTANIAALYIMGGAFKVKGNVTDFAEFNFYLDPEAAQVVFSSSVPIFCSPLDVTSQIALTKAEFEKIRALNTKASKFFTETHDWALRRKNKNNYAILWDETAALWLIDNGLIQGDKGSVLIDTGSERQGQTNFTKSEKNNSTIGLKINQESFSQHFYSWLNNAY